MASILKNDDFMIREVWDYNLEDELKLIAQIVDVYPFVAMDTEFPGIVEKIESSNMTINELNFQKLKANCDVLKMIQLGLTFFDEEGKFPTCGTDKYCVWQFTFREFNVDEDRYAEESINLLKKCGIDFNKNREKGVDSVVFSEKLMSSGVVMNGNLQWITFHGGYDFGYFLKMLTGRKPLPDTREGFYKLIKDFFPVHYDIKQIIQFDNSLYGGLNKVGEQLGVERIGTSHLAGPDSLHTCRVFMALKSRLSPGLLEKYAGVLHGLGVDGD